jgi:hypothetical protein
MPADYLNARSVQPASARLDSGLRLGLPRPMGRFAVILCLAAPVLAACGPDVPELDARIEGSAAPFPELVPLGPLLARVDAVPPRAAAPEGQSLEARAADLRRRAAALRAIPL